MYIPHYYKNENLEEVKDFLKKNSFGILVNQLNGRPWATHIPLELDVDQDGKEVLVGHIAKANPQWKSLHDGQEVLCIFNGPHAYVSSSWYHEEEVPTWDYIAVHVYGCLHFLNEAELMDSLVRLVDKYEGESETPVQLKNMSKKTMRQIKGIVGFKIAITEIQAAYKLSQTRPQDHPKIVLELNKKADEGSREIARIIGQHPKK